MSFPATSDISNGPMPIPKALTALSTSIGDAPSSSKNIVSSVYHLSMRLPTNPSQLPTKTPICTITKAFVHEDVEQLTTHTNELEPGKPM